MQRLIPLLLSLLLSGCSNGELAATVPEASRVLTVNEFLARPDLREKIGAVCSNDPGRTMLDANCTNVRRADHIAMAGGAIPKIDTSIP